MRLQPQRPTLALIIFKLGIMYVYIYNYIYNFHYVSSHTKGKYVAIDLDSTVIQSLSSVDITGSVGGASSSTSYSNFFVVLIWLMKHSNKAV